MREIKFRAWDKTTKNMIQDYAHTCNYGQLSVAQFVPEAYSNKGCPDLILLQFTGLKDKNGKEIYEGDIVKHGIYCNGSVNGEYISQIEWGETGDSDGYYYSGHITYTTKQNHNSLLDVHKSSEIIGNIYENPELLESK